MKQLQRGILLSVEGIDGSGKSLLVNNLHEKLIKESFSAIITKEPGATALGKRLRTILQEQKVPLASKAEFLLFAADRAQHFTEVIIPHLEKKDIIVSDRMADSSLVYQGYGRGLSHDIIKTVNAWAMDSITPDITFYVRVDVDTALARLKERNQTLSAFEQEKRSFFEQLVEGFETELANRENVIIIDGSAKPADVARQAYNELHIWMTKQQLLTS